MLAAATTSVALPARNAVAVADAWHSARARDALAPASGRVKGAREPIGRLTIAGDYSSGAPQDLQTYFQVFCSLGSENDSPSKDWRQLSSRMESYKRGHPKDQYWICYRRWTGFLPRM